MYAIQLSNGCRWDSSYLIRDKNYCEQALTIKITILPSTLHNGNILTKV